MKKIIVFLSICAVILVLAACASPASQTGGGDLTGSVWGLTELTGKPLVAGTGISAEFSADGKVSGSAGCNRYSGTYTISGNSITFSSPMAATMMMCDAAVMEQEAAYLKALGEAKGKEMFLVYLDNIEPDRLLNLGVEAAVSTACPRIALDDAAKYKIPILTPPEFEVLMGKRDWEEYEFDEIDE